MRRRDERSVRAAHDEVRSYKEKVRSYKEG